MIIRRAETTDATPITLDGVRDVDMRLMVGRADGAPNFSMRHFTVRPGGHTPRHEHNYEHEVFVVRGGGTVEYDGETHRIREGDVLFVQPNRVHQFVNDTDANLEFLCLVPARYDCAVQGADTPVPGS